MGGTGKVSMGLVNNFVETIRIERYLRRVDREVRIQVGSRCSFSGWNRIWTLSHTQSTSPLTHVAPIVLHLDALLRLAPVQGSAQDARDVAPALEHCAW
jgi:hypothetical protein